MEFGGSRRQGKALSTRLAIIEMARYGKRVILANSDGTFNCSLGPDGDLILTPVKPRCEITQAWLDETKPTP